MKFLLHILYHTTSALWFSVQHILSAEIKLRHVSYFICGIITKHKRPMIMWIAMNNMKNSLLSWSPIDFHSSDTVFSSPDLPLLPNVRISSREAASTLTAELSSVCQLASWAVITVCDSDISKPLLVTGWPWPPLPWLQAQRQRKQSLAFFTHLGTALWDVPLYIFTVITCMSRLIPHMAKIMER